VPVHQVLALIKQKEKTMNTTKDFFMMLVPAGTLAAVSQDFDSDWLSSRSIRVSSIGTLDIVSAFVETPDILSFYSRLRSAAHQLQDLHVDAEMEGTTRTPTTDLWGILAKMQMDYRGSPMDFSPVPLSSYVEA
jgi:hypothetical protein